MPLHMALYSHFAHIKSLFELPEQQQHSTSKEIKNGKTFKNNKFTHTISFAHSIILLKCSSFYVFYVNVVLRRKHNKN